MDERIRLPELQRFALALQDHGIEQRKYRTYFHEYAKIYLYGLYEILWGDVLLDDERKVGLPYRLKADQWDRARRAGLEIWRIIQEAELEASPIVAARGDSAFQFFLQAATKPKRRRRGA